MLNVQNFRTFLISYIKQQTSLMSHFGGYFPQLSSCRWTSPTSRNRGSTQPSSSWTWTLHGQGEDTALFTYFLKLRLKIKPLLNVCAGSMRHAAVCFFFLHILQISAGIQVLQSSQHSAAWHQVRVPQRGDGRGSQSDGDLSSESPIKIFMHAFSFCINHINVRFIRSLSSVVVLFFFRINCLQICTILWPKNQTMQIISRQ